MQKREKEEQSSLVRDVTARVSFCLVGIDQAVAGSPAAADTPRHLPFTAGNPTSCLCPLLISNYFPFIFYKYFTVERLSRFGQF